ncbi:hypothetical protein PSCICN_48320 [Pseudomonas cichorii]|nr:hypothetical protein PSCICN_48320 [Pseudomonas cichorii]
MPERKARDSVEAVLASRIKLHQRRQLPEMQRGLLTDFTHSQEFASEDSAECIPIFTQSLLITSPACNVLNPRYARRGCDIVL